MIESWIGFMPLAKHLGHPRVPKQVRVHALRDPRPPHRVLDDLVDATVGQRLRIATSPPAMPRKDRIESASSGRLSMKAVEATEQDRRRRRDVADPIALAEHTEVRLPTRATMSAAGQLVSSSRRSPQSPKIRMMSLSRSWGIDRSRARSISARLSTWHTASTGEVAGAGGFRSPEQPGRRYPWP